VDSADARALLTQEYRIAPDAAAMRLLRAQLRALLVDHGFAAAKVEATLLGLDEVLTNACFHGDTAARGETVELSVAVWPDRLEMEVRDRGEFVARDGHAKSAAQLPDDDAESGRGLFLIHSTMDEVSFAPRPGGGTRVRLVKRR
jgi:serine/threonine-protein kinase RsbW